MDKDNIILTRYSTLIANLIGELDRTTEIAPGVTPKTMPDGMDTLRDIFDAVLSCSAHRITPTKANVVFRLSTSYDYELNRAEKLIKALLEKQTEDLDVHNISHLLQGYLQDMEQRRIWREAGRIVTDGHGSIETRAAKAFDKVSAVRPDQSGDYIRRSDQQLSDYMVETQRRRTQHLKEGRPIGPSLKFKGFVGTEDEPGIVPNLIWGDSTVVTGLSKMGKTTFGLTWAVWNAYFQEGMDVCLMHNETGQESLWDRFIASQTLIRTDYIRSGALDLEDENDEKSQAYWKVVDWINTDKKNDRDTGTLVYHYCPGWDKYKVASQIQAEAAASARRGRGLLIILDYYNLIPKDSSDGGTEASQLGAIALHLRNAVKIQNMKMQKEGSPGLHFIMFSQQTGSGKSATPYGSHVIQHTTQMHIVIDREEAETDAPMGSQKDMHGFQRHWHRKGEWAAATKLHVVRANEFAQGTVNVNVENAYFRISNG